MSCRIGIIDLGIGNVNSVRKAMSLMNTHSVITSDADQIKHVDKLILPGIGHFQKAMQALGNLALSDILNELVLQRKKPILGICLGMQIMATESEEGNTRGLGWLDARVVKFKNQTGRLKIPHMGWNSISRKNGSLILKDLSEQEEVYFTHSYHWETEKKDHVTGETEYGDWFASAIEKENIFGVQFHPEKSHDPGLKLLQNFVSL